MSFKSLMFGGMKKKKKKPGFLGWVGGGVFIRGGVGSFPLVVIDRR